MRHVALAFVLLVTASTLHAGEAPSYAKHVRPIFAKYCLECHNTKSAKGGLDLETHKAMLEGSDNGPVLTIGNADKSLLVQSVEGKARSVMPPKSKTLRPTKAEIATLRAWINAGAKDDSKLIKVAIPDIKPKKPAATPVRALIYGSGGRLAYARDGKLVSTLFSPRAGEDHEQLKPGEPISSLALDRQGRFLAVARGRPASRSEIVVLDRGSGLSLVSRLPGHQDAVLDMAFSPDGKTIATCSYDTQVKLWDWGSWAVFARRAGAAQRQVKVLKDHSDSVYGVAFHPQGKMLATCGADRTVKIWDTATAKLLFTFSESTDWNYAVAWRPNGKHLAAAGVDKSIRVWEVNEQGGRIIHAVFAHEGPVTRLIYSKDGGTLYSLGEDRVVKAWDAERMVERKIYDRQPETILCMALRPDGKQLALGRYDGVVQFLDTATGKAHTATIATTEGQDSAPVRFGQKTAGQERSPVLRAQATAKPEATKITPGEGRRGVPIRVTIEGKNLDHVSELVLKAEGATSKIHNRSATKLEAEITFPATTPASVQQIQVKNGAGVSGAVSLIVDLFPATMVREGNDSPGQGQPITLPASLAGKLDKTGDLDFFRIDVKKGQQLGVQILTAAVGSKIEPTLQLADLNGRVLAESNEGFLGHTFAETGAYALGVRDREFRGGAGMHYRLHVGEIPIVSAVEPLGIQRGTEVDVRVTGVFLASKSVKVNVPADAVVGGKIPVPVASPLGQPLGNASVVVGEFPEVTAGQIAVIGVPGTANGSLSHSNEQDEWRFRAAKGQRLIVEAHAQRFGSRLDPVIEILDAHGNPVPRAVLRCQAKTYVTFRDHDSNTAGIRIEAWSDLAVNDYIYMGGELVKIKALPAHPDADCIFFAAANGPRLAFLDTTPTHHSQNLPMYKVTIHPPGMTFPPNGFPVFTLNYRNDDGGPGYGRDSRIVFDPAADGEYRVRVNDARGEGGVNFGYRLTIRPPRPSFNVRFNPTSPVVWKEGAVPLTIAVDRLDGYGGPIAVRFDNVPPGFHIPKTEVQAGETTTAVALYAEAIAQTPAKPMPLKLIAEAIIDGQKQVKEAAGETPKVTGVGDIVTFTDESAVTIRPGGQVKVLVHIERRGGFTGRVPLEVKGLPHGVRVLDIGLNGILITEKETRRTIVLHAESWVEPTEHPFVILAKREGKNSEHAAKSVLLKVQGK